MIGTPTSRAGRLGAAAALLACAIVATALLAPASGHAQDRGLDVLHSASARYASVETLCARFTQHLRVPLLGTERVGTGRVCQGRPNLFAMRFEEPAGDLIVVDGDFAWVYFPSSDARTVLKTTADRAAGGRDFHREFLDQPESKYDVRYEQTDDVDGHPTHRLRMIPKLPSSYRVATVWIDTGTPVLRRIRLEEENGNVRTITLSDVGFGEEPGAGWFRFTPPDGVLVMMR